MGPRAARRERVDVAALASAMRKRELDLRVVELLDAGALAVPGLDLLYLDDLDAVRLGAMASAHVTVALNNKR